MSFTPIVIIGAGRSGTNLLRDMLTQLSGVTTWPCDEINPVWKHGNLGRTDALTPEDARPDVRAYIRRAFERRARADGAEVVVEKTCANSLRVGFVNAVLPEARFVHLVRDGRDVTASAMKRWRSSVDLGYTLRKVRFVPPSDLPVYGGRFLANRLGQALSKERQLKVWGPTFEGLETLAQSAPLDVVCAQQWRECVDASDRDFARLAAHRVCTIYYENLVLAPEAELARLSEFLDFPSGAPGRMLAANEVSQTGVGRWREQFSAAVAERVEAAAGPALDRHGYWSLGQPVVQPAAEPSTQASSAS